MASSVKIAAKLAPSTDAHLGNSGGWQAVGYDFRHTSIEGFANFHEFQVGGIVFGNWLAEMKPAAMKSLIPTVCKFFASANF